MPPLKSTDIADMIPVGNHTVRVEDSTPEDAAAVRRMLNDNHKPTPFSDMTSAEQHTVLLHTALFSGVEEGLDTPGDRARLERKLADTEVSITIERRRQEADNRYLTWLFGFRAALQARLQQPPTAMAEVPPPDDDGDDDDADEDWDDHDFYLRVAEANAEPEADPFADPIYD